MAAVEQRRHQRVPFVADVVLDGSRRCTSSDISEGGIYISDILASEEGAVVDVTIPFRGKELTVRGKVRHYQPGIGVGIMFVDLDDAQREKLHDMIASAAQGTL